MYVAIFLSENIFLNVVLNVLALEFIANLDDALIHTFISRIYDHSTVSLAILQIDYSVNEDDEFWAESNSSKRAVREKLKTDNKNNLIWMLLTSSSSGLGLLGRLQDGRECVNSFSLQIGILDWFTISDEEIIQNGALFMEGTSDGIWAHCVSKQQRALLFKHYPEVTINRPWFGCVNVAGMGLRHSHVDFIAHILNNNTDALSLDASENNFGDDAVMTLFEKLEHNKTLKKINLANCYITNQCAIAIADSLRRNTSLRHCWLSNNFEIRDSGALALALALAKDGDDDVNNTLLAVHMMGTNVSEECQKRCTYLSNGRIIFQEKYT